MNSTSTLILPEMLALVVEFRIDETHIDEFETAMLENARLSLERESGCRQFDVCRDASDPSIFFLYEIYDNEQAITDHLRSEHFLSMDRNTSAWVVHKSVRRLQRMAP